MVLLNTDLHNKSVKPEKKMKQDDFVRNLRGIDNGSDVDCDMLRGIYDRIKSSEFVQGADHVSQVTKVQETILGSKRPNLNTTARRLVCFCRVSEVTDMEKKEKKDAHQRGIFLFNDMMVVTNNEKSKKRQIHQYRYSLGLADLRVNMFRTQHHQFGVQLQERHTSRVAATLAAGPTTTSRGLSRTFRRAWPRRRRWRGPGSSSTRSPCVEIYMWHLYVISI